MYLGDAHVGEGGDGVSVQRAERHLVEVDEAELGDAGSRERGGGVGPDAADADDYDKGIAELLEAFGAEEYAVPRELFEDEFVVKVAGLRALCQEEVVFVLLVEFRDVCACGLMVRLSVQGPACMLGVASTFSAVLLLSVGSGMDCFKRDSLSPCWRRWKLSRAAVATAADTAAVAASWSLEEDDVCERRDDIVMSVGE